ncbi:hypothetical protein FHT40_004423 [Mycolicibacterium sp. BK556]|uniref:hypothetical protein n=1 Tax=Mycobacteriaceae TaxID=1762 RepID=UPI00105B28BA|nr:MULTISPECIES: hypothetical protein [Mycobacteriaceae]MBB3604745.1 hypothetical protein [Mycolicibacterium sp. BK556]MBB3634542.1 hypothetical protein [Mycolicibacterium sp. BK607]MBB3752119.1 hypothetical protein [Mycolicibacterium sp. BK634]TDO17634.1 hypothetical protein EV580_0808 [Mycobacterium sp. BK086]
MFRIAMVAAAAALTTVAMAPNAYAANSRIQFLSPSGNVGCQLGTAPDRTAFAWCKVNEHSWATPESDTCPRANVPGAIGEPGGENLQLAEGQAPCFGFVMSQLFFTGQYAPPTLDYGARRSVGSITCTIERAGVTCADSKSGRSFQVSHDAYTLS